MTTRNIDALFETNCIALIGASNQAGSIGAMLARNLIEDGFAVAVLPINPHEAAIRSVKAYATIADMPLTPDLAVIAAPPDSIPQLIADLGAQGCRAAIVITAGLVSLSSTQALRMRIHGSMSQLSPSLAARLSQIDYDCEMALVAQSRSGDIVGVARLNADPEGESAEFALLVRTDWQDKGLGHKLMGRLLEYADDQGLRTVWGSVLGENISMLDLCSAFGFSRRAGESAGPIRIARERPTSEAMNDKRQAETSVSLIYT